MSLTFIERYIHYRITGYSKMFSPPHRTLFSPFC